MLTPLEAVQGVLDLMETAGRPMDEWEPDVIVPHTNGYGVWFIDGRNFHDTPSTAPMTAEEILARIEARRDASSQKPITQDEADDLIEIADDEDAYSHSQPGKKP